MTAPQEKVNKHIGSDFDEFMKVNYCREHMCTTSSVAEEKACKFYLENQSYFSCFWYCGRTGGCLSSEANIFLPENGLGVFSKESEG